MDSNRFQEMLRQAGEGSNDAARQLVAEYEGHLRSVIRRRIRVEMQSNYDSTDITQMVWASFFRDPKRALQITDAEQLLRYLTKMASNKLIGEYRKRFTKKRHPYRETAYHPEMAKDNETPSAKAIARERWSRLMSQQNQLNRQVVSLRFRGATHVEIGQRLGINERTVRKVLDRVKADGEEGVSE